MKNIFILLLIFFACLVNTQKVYAEKSEVQKYGDFAIVEKTILIPPGSDGLKGKIKQALANDGWKLSVYSGPTVIEGEIGQQTKLEQYDTFNSRYKLLVSSKQIDLCIRGLTPEIRYDISFIDNKTGSELFTMSGRGCEPKVVSEFIELLK